MIKLALSSADFTPGLCWLIGVTLLGPALLAWIKVIEYFTRRQFDHSQFVTQAQLAALRSDRDLQLKSSFELLTSKLDYITTTVDRLDQDLRQVRGDMPSLHRAIGVVEGHDEAEARLRRPH